MGIVLELCCFPDSSYCTIRWTSDVFKIPSFYYVFLLFLFMSVILFFLSRFLLHSFSHIFPSISFCLLSFLTFSPFLFFFSLLFSLYPISSFISFSVFFFFALGFSIFFIYFLFSGFTDWFNSLVLSFSFFISFLLLVVYYYFCFLPLPLRLSFLLDTSDCEALYMTHYSRLVVNQPG